MISSLGVAAARRAAAPSSLHAADYRLSALAVAAPGRRQQHRHRRQQSTSLFSTNNPARKNVVVVDGVRLPFAMTSTIYEDQLAVDLQRLAYQGLVTKTALNKGDVDYIIAGTVIQEVRTSNIAREAGINAGFPASIGAHTVSMVRSIHGGCYHTVAINFVSFRSFVAMLLSIIITFLRSQCRRLEISGPRKLDAQNTNELKTNVFLSEQACISSSVAITSAAEKILCGQASCVIAGGVETFSDVPIRLTRPIRQKLITMPKAMKKGGPLGAIRHLTKGLKMKDISLETPAIANYTTGEVMGVSSDRLSAKFGVSRLEQDEFTVRSHAMAGKAHKDG